MNKYFERLYNGVVKENPTLILMLGMCPTLAVSTRAMNGIGMGLSTTAVLILSNLVISLLRKAIPDEVRLPCYIVVVASLVLKFTSFGRGVYAIGGNEQSARLMGLKADSIRWKAYIISGFCAALGGITYSWIMLSGYTQHGLGMEMDAIASSVIGGTQLLGGVAFIPGTLLGVMIQGTILTIISFQGTLSAWWTKIVVGILLCLFIVMQALVSEHKNKLMNLKAEKTGGKSKDKTASAK